jgi:hypothetical protein
MTHTTHPEVKRMLTQFVREFLLFEGIIDRMVAEGIIPPVPNYSAEVIKEIENDPEYKKENYMSKVCS